MKEKKDARYLRRSRRGGLAISSGMVGLVALLVLTAPLASAASPQKVYTAPYTGLPVVVTIMATAGCGAALTVPSWPVFDLTTGIGTTSLSTSAKHCPDAGGVDDALIIAEVGYNGSTFKQAATGTHDVVAKLSFSWNAVVKAKPGSTTQLAASAVYIYAYVYLYDGTNGTTPALGYKTALSLYSTSGTHSSAKVGAIFSATTNSAKLVKNHQYLIEVYVVVDVTAQVLSAGTSTASASLNLATSGDQFKLDSVTVN